MPPPPATPTTSVTFSIDMTGMWSGDYADLRLHVTGSFDGWCAGDNKAACASDYTVSPLITRLQPSERDPMIYEVTIPFAPMSARFNTSSTWPGNLDGVVWYKIVPYKWGWATGSYGEQGYPENLDWDQPCLAKDENGNRNRYLTTEQLSGAPITLPTVCLHSCSPCNRPPSSPPLPPPAPPPPSPSPPSPPPPSAPPPPPPCLCSDSCLDSPHFAGDGYCDDGGEGAE